LIVVFAVISFDAASSPCFSFSAITAIIDTLIARHAFDDYYFATLR